jgi:hypothetical protein
MSGDPLLTYVSGSVKCVTKRCLCQNWEAQLKVHRSHLLLWPYRQSDKTNTKPESWKAPNMCRVGVLIQPIHQQRWYRYLPRLFTPLKKTPWSETASELYWQSDRRLSAKWLPTFADRGCHVVSVTDPYGRILGFLDRSCSFSIK